MNSVCYLPQPPDGLSIGCGKEHEHNKLCESWRSFGVSSLDQVPTALSYMKKLQGTVQDSQEVDDGFDVKPFVHFIHGTPVENLKPSHYLDFDTMFAPSPEGPRNCYYLQPPDGQTRGCGEKHSDNQVCKSWICWGVESVDIIGSFIKAFVESMPGRTDLDVLSGYQKACHKPQPPNMSRQGCGQPPHRGLCLSWKRVGVMNEQDVESFVSQYSERASVQDDWRLLLVDQEILNSIYRITQLILSEIRQFREHSQKTIGVLYRHRSLLFQREGRNDLSLVDINKALQCHPGNVSYLGTKALLLCSSPIFAVSSSGALQSHQMTEVKRQKTLDTAIRICSIALRRLSHLGSMDSDEKVLLETNLLLIRAGCLIWKRDFSSCIEDATRMLVINDGSVVPLVLEGLSLGCNSSFEEAFSTLSEIDEKYLLRFDLRPHLEALRALNKRKGTSLSYVEKKRTN